MSVKFRSLLTISACFFFAAQLVAHADDRESKRSTMNYIEKTWGRAISHSEDPFTYAQIEDLVARLDKAAAGYGGAKATTSDVVILDSPIINACVISGANFKKTLFTSNRNTVYISRALIEDLEKKSPDDALLALSGVIAHEIAHPMNDIDTKGFQSRGLTGQAVEFRADLEAVELLRRAGLPESALYRAYELLLTENSGTALSEVSRPHPQNKLRKSVQRVALTLNRHERGEIDQDYPVWSDQSRAEISHLHPTLSQDKALSKMLKGESMSSEDLDELAQSLRSRKVESFSPAEISAIARSYLAGVFKDKNYGNRYRIGDIPLFQSQAYLDEVKRQLATEWKGKINPSESEFGVKLSILQGAIPSQSIPSFFKSEIGEWMKRSGGNWAEEVTLSPEARAELAARFMTEFYPQLTATQRNQLQLNKGLQDTLLFMRRMEPSNPNQAEIDEVHRPARAAFEKLDPVESRKIAEAIWKDRGRIGSLEALTPYAYRDIPYLELVGLSKSSDTLSNYGKGFAYPRVDWTWVEKQLGISEEKGNEQIRQAVHEYMQTENYATMVRQFAKTEDRKNPSHPLNEESTGSGQTPHSELKWAGKNLYSDAMGTHNRWISSDPELLKIMMTRVQPQLLSASTEQFRMLYREALTKTIAANLDNLNKRPDLYPFSSVRDQVVKDLLGEGVFKNSDKSLLRMPANADDIEAEVIDSSSLNEETKKRLLRYRDRHSFSDRANVLAADEILLKHGVAQSGTGLLDLYKPAYSDRMGEVLAPRRKHVVAILPLLDKQLNEIEKMPGGPAKADALVHFAENIYYTFGGINFGSSSDVGLDVTLMKPLTNHLIGALDNSGLSLEQRYKLFQLALERIGPTQVTDSYYEHHLVPDLLDHPGMIIKMGSHYVSDPEVSFRVMKLTMAPRIQQLAQSKTPVDEKTLKKLISDINSVSPENSPERDQFFEDLAWKLNLNDSKLLSLIENEKSRNFRRADPYLANQGSFLATALDDLDEAGHLEAINYLIHSKGDPIPASLEAAMQRQIQKTALAQLNLSRLSSVDAGGEELQIKQRQALETAKERFMRFTTRASSDEKILLFDLLLNTGKPPLSEKQDLPTFIARRYLKYEPNSTQEKLLNNYIKVAPDHESTPTLSYLLSRADQDGSSSTKALFEVFKTLGIKSGQIASIWNLFGDEMSKELASLKDQASPMSKAEIVEVLDRELSPTERAKIKSVKKILGSASMKSVAQVELTDGREVVIAVQRPHLLEQVRSTVQVLRKFVEAAAKDLPDLKLKSLRSLINAMEKQVVQEADMLNEAKNIQQAHALYEKLNLEFGPDMKGWKFEVPSLTTGFKPTSSLLVMDQAPPTTYKELTPSQQHETGDLIVRSSLRTLFRDGFFDPDRHAGNFLFDPKAKKIYLIDFGQAENYSKKASFLRDDIYHLSQFIRALKEKNVDNLLQFGLKLSDKSANPKSVAQLREELAEIIRSSKNPQDQITSLLEAFNEAGVPWNKKYSVGVVKGQFTLQGEKYVSPERFETLLSAEVKHILTDSKKIITVIDEGCLISGIRSAIHLK
jgi:predicted unusual protein kinase regulating ubiquinone biosynthesis (AarF/ABC1/UbiB family)